MLFSQRVKELRIANKYTQIQMAKLVNLSERQYQSLEADTWKPRYNTLLAIADHFDVSVDYLMGRTDNPKINR